LRHGFLRTPVSTDTEGIRTLLLEHIGRFAQFIGHFLIERQVHAGSPCNDETMKHYMTSSGGLY
jgi:hypothetical protein